MPTFDFQCRKCSHVFEFTRPFGGREKPACPKCKSTRTEKLLTSPAVQFRGSGFYKTDSVKLTPSEKQTPPKKAEAPATPATPPAPKSSDKEVY
jgi:putative FmdB family regulatory protein